VLWPKVRKRDDLTRGQLISHLISIFISYLISIFDADHAVFLAFLALS